MEKALSWEIDNVYGRNDLITSNIFSCGGCEWSLLFFPENKGSFADMHLFLQVAGSASLRHGWKRRALYCFVFLNQSGKVLYRSTDISSLFCAEIVGHGFATTLTKEKGFLEKYKLTIELYAEVVEVVHHGKSTANDVLEFNGFQIMACQINSVSGIFLDHPDFADDVRTKDQGIKTAYMNSLLRVVEMLNKSPQSLSVTERSHAQRELTLLTEAGFKLDWLHLRLEPLSLERKKALSDGSWIQQVEERVNTVELALSDLRVELDKEKIKSAAAAKVSSFEFIDFLIKRLFFSLFLLLLINRLMFSDTIHV